MNKYPNKFIPGLAAKAKNKMCVGVIFIRQWPVRQCHYEQASCWNGERFVFTMQNVVLHTCFGKD